MAENVVSSSQIRPDLACTAIGKGSQFLHENEKWVQSPVRLVECRACFRVLHIGICRSEQKRGYALTDKPEKGCNLLRQEHSFRHSGTVLLVHWVWDYRQPDGIYRAWGGARWGGEVSTRKSV